MVRTSTHNLCFRAKIRTIIYITVSLYKIGGSKGSTLHGHATVMCLKLAASQQNLSLGFPTRLDTNQAVQPQKMARGDILSAGAKFCL